MKVLVIGFGYWGRKWVKILIEYNHLEQVSVYDIDQSLSSKVRELKLKFWIDLNKALRAVELVIVATPEETHYRMVKLCLDNGKHVLVEKPLCFRLIEANRLIKLANKKKLKLMVDNTFLFDESYVEIKKEIDCGLIGKLKKISSIRFSPIYRQQVNVIVDLMPHDLAIFNDLIKIELKAIKVKSEKSKKGVIDQAWIDFDFGEIETSSWLSWINSVSKREMIFYGDKGVICWQKLNNQTDLILIDKYNKNKKLVRYKTIEVKNKEKTLLIVFKVIYNSVINNQELKKDTQKTLLLVAMLEKILKRVL